MSPCAVRSVYESSIGTDIAVSASSAPAQEPNVMELGVMLEVLVQWSWGVLAAP
jgi:hypothetical protein